MALPLLAREMGDVFEGMVQERSPGAGAPEGRREYGTGPMRRARACGSCADRKAWRGGERAPGARYVRTDRRSRGRAGKRLHPAQPPVNRARTSCASSPLTISSASRSSSQSCRQASSPTRFWWPPPSHSCFTILAPAASAAATVPSVEPESTTTTSRTTERAARTAAPIRLSSLRVRM